MHDEPSQLTAEQQFSSSLIRGDVEAVDRYTHVFVKNQDQWHLVSAQGTQISS